MTLEKRLITKQSRKGQSSVQRIIGTKWGLVSSPMLLHEPGSCWCQSIGNSMALQFYQWKKFTMMPQKECANIPKTLDSYLMVLTKSINKINPRYNIPHPNIPMLVLTQVNVQSIQWKGIPKYLYPLRCRPMLDNFPTEPPRLVNLRIQPN